MNKFFFSITYVLLMASTPLFSSLPFLPIFEESVCWEGFYLSGQLGMGANVEYAKFKNPNYFNTLGPVLLGNKFHHHKSQGFIGGGALGYNHQMDNLVVGIEAGAISTNFKKTQRSPFFPSTDFFTSHLMCIGSVKARLGYVYDDSLLTFITGGWASGHDAIKLFDRGNNIAAKLNSWANGWTIGLGFDCKCVEWFSLGLSYDYIQLEYHNEKASCSKCGTGIGLGSPKLDNKFHIQTLTFRVNYYFN